MELDGNYGLSQAEIDRINQELLEQEKQQAQAESQAAQVEAQQAEEPQQQQVSQASPQAATPPKVENPQNQNKFQQGLAEAGNAARYGLNEAARSVTTGHERWQAVLTDDNFDGNTFEPEFDPFRNDELPMAQTWWSGLIQNSTKGIALAGGLFLAARGGAKATKNVPVVGRGLKALTSMPKTKAGTLTRSGIFSVAETAVDIDSQKDTMADAVVQRVPWMSGPLSLTTTNETDGPLLKTFKNGAEQLSLVGVADWVSFRIGDGIEGIKARRASVEKSTVEAGQQQALESAAIRATDDEITTAATEFNTRYPDRDFNDLDVGQQAQLLEVYRDNSVLPPRTDVGAGEFGGYKNKPLSDPWQAAPMSGKESAFDVLFDANLIGKRADGLGSTDMWTSPKMAANLARDPGQFQQYMTDTVKNLLGDKRFKELVKANDPDNLNPKSIEEIFRGSYDRYQEVMGRNVAAMDPAEFWAPLKRSDKRGGFLKDSEVLAADLINAELFTQIRDTALISREIGKFADLDDVDGPLKTLTDRLTVGLTNVKKAEKVRATAAIGKEMKKSNVAELNMKATLEAAEEAKAEVETLLQLVRSDASTDTVDAVMEIFSMAGNKPQNVKDVMRYIKEEMGSTGFAKDKPKGMVFNELNGVTTNSLLSGPRTPLKALKGTAVVSVIRPLQTSIGAVPGSLMGNMTSRNVLRSNMAGLNAIRETVPEAMKLFQTKLRSYWAGDIATIKTRYSDYSAKSEAAWERQRWYAEDSGLASFGDQAAFAISNVSRKINDTTLFNYNTKIMAATDDAFRPVMARAHARRKALYQALEEAQAGKIDNPTDVAKRYEDNFYNSLVDENGDIDISRDTVLESNYREATLTTKLEGFGKDLDDIMQRNAFTAPFFKFTRTKLNEINLNYKNMPMLGLLHKQSIDIMRATDESLELVAKYGINSPEELANAKALLIGRQAFGTGVTFQATQFYMDGNLTGDGPEDPKVLASWRRRGWKPRHIRIFGKWYNYDSLVPFNMMLAGVANVGDNMKVMGPRWAEESLAKIPLALLAGEMDKAYFESFTPLQDLLGKNPGKAAAQLANNQVPLASLRGSVGKILTPYFRELDNDWKSTIRNRNLSMEYLAGDDALPVKTNLLNGEPLRDWNFLERTWAEINPFGMAITEEPSPGQLLLEQSMYGNLPVRATIANGLNLKNKAPLRALYQSKIGLAPIRIGFKKYKNPEEALGALSKNPTVLASLKQMEEDFRNGKPMKPDQYPHTDMIDDVFRQAQDFAWSEIQDNPEIQALVDEQNKKAADEFNRKRELQTKTLPPSFVQMYK